MNNKVFLKIGWIFTLSLISYLLFVVFFLSPKINNYLSETEIDNTKRQFNKIVSVINNNSKIIDDKDKFLNEINLLTTSINLGKTGYVIIVDSRGTVVFDPSGEFKSQDFSKIIIPSMNNSLLFDELKKSFVKQQMFKYNWNRVYDPYNYNYEKISWVEYNSKMDWYIISSVYKEDFTSFVGGINTLILSVSVALFCILAIIAFFIVIKIIVPLNKIYSDVKKISQNDTTDNRINSKDEIGYLANQFNTLLDEVENNKRTLDERVQVKTQEIQNKLYRDELTNLKNRKSLEEDIKNNDFVSIALIDIDSFDDINELYGFTTGNLVLIEVAKILKEFAEKYKVQEYRFYGNVYCLADKRMMSFSKYDEFINELCILFKNRAIYIEELSLDIFINITLGISIAQEEPIKTAGIALKKAKKNNMKFFVYNNEIDTKDIIKKSIYWREKIKTSIEEDNVVPFYQAIFNRDNEVVKYETLMRLKDKNSDEETIYLSPYLFLDVSVKTKQYLQLSNQVISKAFDDIAKTKKQISLNLSFKDILDIDFVISLDKNLDKIDSHKKEQIVFEILESDYISDYSLLEEFVVKYRNQGIKIAIDDFGTGYSNFAHILKIKPDYIKIDGSLIKNINTDKNSFELVKSIIDFSKALNIKVIAEFVHSKAVFDTIWELGVDEFQGFYLAEPSLNIE